MECKTCKWWGGAGLVDVFSAGCKRHAPTSVDQYVSTGAGQMAAWPVTMDYDRCGDYVRLRLRKAKN